MIDALFCSCTFPTKGLEGINKAHLIDDVGEQMMVLLVLLMNRLKQLESLERPKAILPLLFVGCI